MDGNELGSWLKSFFGLPFLQLEKVEEGFLELMSRDCNKPFVIHLRTLHPIPIVFQ